MTNFKTVFGRNICVSRLFYDHEKPANLNTETPSFRTRPRSQHGYTDRKGKQTGKVRKEKEEAKNTRNPPQESTEENNPIHTKHVPNLKKQLRSNTVQERENENRSPMKPTGGNAENTDGGRRVGIQRCSQRSPAPAKKVFKHLRCLKYSIFAFALLTLRTAMG